MSKGVILIIVACVSAAFAGFILGQRRVESDGPYVEREHERPSPSLSNYSMLERRISGVERALDSPTIAPPSVEVEKNLQSADLSPNIEPLAETFHGSDRLPADLKAENELHLLLGQRGDDGFKLVTYACRSDICEATVDLSTSPSNVMDIVFEVAPYFSRVDFVPREPGSSRLTFYASHESH